MSRFTSNSKFAHYSYIILCIELKGSKFKMKGVYWHNGQGKTGRLHGPTSIPQEIRDTMIENRYRYDPASKSFKDITSKC